MPFSLFLNSKFMCATHSEAKQTKISEFGAEEDLLQGQAREQVTHAQKTPGPSGFQGRGFKFLWGFFSFN